MVTNKKIVSRTMLHKPWLENISFDNVTAGTELENCKTNSIFKDKKGLMWFATDKGLFRYDGANFKRVDIYRELPDVSNDNDIRGLTCGNGRNIILITATGNVLDYDLNNESCQNLTFSFHNYLKGNDALRMCEDSQNNLWIGTSANGVFRYNRLNQQAAHFKYMAEDLRFRISGDVISTIHFDKTVNKMYIGTYGRGLNIIDLSKQNISSIVLDRQIDVHESHVAISFVFRDLMQNLWVGSPSLISRLDASERVIDKINFYQENFDNINGNYVTCMCEDSHGLYWIGTPMGLICYDSNEEKYERINFKASVNGNMFSNYVINMLTDQDNVIWIGTRDSGIFRFDRNEKKFLKVNIKIGKEDTIANNTYCLHNEGSNLWVGSVADGAYRLCKADTNEYEIERFSNLKYTTVTGFNRDDTGRLWIGCNKFGLVYLDTNSQINVIDYRVILDGLDSPTVYSACQCKDGTNPDLLWLSIVYKKLVQFDMKKMVVVGNKLISDKFDNVPVHFLMSDSRKNLWIGTGGHGIFKYVRSEEKIYDYELDPAIPFPVINLIEEDKFGNIWIGTKTNGLFRNSGKDLVFESFETPVTQVSGLMFDEEGFLWISSERNLHKVHPETHESVIYKDLNDFNDHSYTKSEDGTMYFGGKNGVTYFKPEEIKTNPHIPQIALTDFKILHESVKPSPDNPYLKKSITYADEITLTHKENVITFEFASLIYNDPKQNQHAYKMEGFDEDWVYCGTRRSATYTNLDPGEYTFIVKGSNNDGLWNEEGTSIKLKISPPWHKTVLFKGLIGLGALAGLGSFYRKRISRLNEENMQREEFTKKLIESQENERKRVAAELHDSIGQDLLILKNKLLTNIKKTGDEKFIQQLSELSELTSSAIDDVRQISYNLRPYELDRLGLTKTIESMIERANNFTDITFTGILDDIDRMFPPETGINIYRIIQESLNNVIKHSGAGKVIVRVRKHGSYIYLSISDNGKGFDIKSHRLSSERNGFGLKGIEERVKLLGGEFDIDSEQGKGTLIEIVIPHVTET